MMLDENYFSDFLFGKSEETVLTYRRVLLRFCAWLTRNEQTINEITRFDLQEYITYCQEVKKYNPDTLRKDFAGIRSYLVFLGKESVLNGVRLPKSQKLLVTPKSLDRNERNRLLRAVEKDQNVRNIAIMYLLYETGIRAHELIQLDREDVQFNYHASQSRLIVRSGKGGKYRIVPFPKESNAKHWLAEYLKTRQDQINALFLSNYHQRLSQRSLNRILQHYGVHPHLLRHTMLSQLARNGVDMATLASIAGHSDLKTTKIYTMPQFEDIQQAMNRAFLDDSY